MRSSLPAAIVVGTSATVGWFWHLAQGHGVPFLIRMPIGVLVLIGIAGWLGHRISQGFWALPDLSGIRLIGPPRNARWLIVAVSTYPAGGQQVIGRYRSRRVACWIANRLPKRAGIRLDVSAADQVSTGTGSKP